MKKYFVFLLVLAGVLTFLHSGHAKTSSMEVAEGCENVVACNTYKDEQTCLAKASYTAGVPYCRWEKGDLYDIGYCKNIPCDIANCCYCIREGECGQCAKGYHLTMENNTCEKDESIIKPKSGVQIIPEDTTPTKADVYTLSYATDNCYSSPEPETKSEPQVCFTGCEVGDYFDMKNKICLKEVLSDDIKNIYLGKTEENGAEVLDYSDTQEKINYTQALYKQGTLDSDYLNKKKFESIKDKILEVYGANCYVLRDGIVKLGADRTVVFLANEESYKKECSKEKTLKGTIIKDFNQEASLIQKIRPLEGTKLAYQGSISVLNALGYAFMAVDGSEDVMEEEILTCEPSEADGCLEYSLEDDKSCQICSGGYIRESSNGKMICLRCEYSLSGDTSGQFDDTTKHEPQFGDGCKYPNNGGWVNNPCQNRSSKPVTVEAASGAESGCYVKQKETRLYHGFPCMTGCKKCTNSITCSECLSGYKLKNGRCTKYECSNREMELNNKKGLGCVCDEGREEDENGCCVEGSDERVVLLLGKIKTVLCLQEVTK